ncbi:MAG: phytanoyl-CoA dioxygenase family protein [Hyphomonadaceae bacterium]
MLDVATPLQALRTQGYAIVKDAIPPALVEELRATVKRLERDYPDVHELKGLKGGFNKTVRVRNLLSRDPIFQGVFEYPPVLAVAEGLLGPEFLLQVSATLTISPGEPAQPLHTDDMYTHLPRPHPPLICNTIWALEDFTEANGATRLVPKSHLWPETPSKTFAEAIANPRQHESIAAEMPSGSIIFFDGALWHGAGANVSGGPRVAIAVSYCAGWMRQQENFQLSIAPELARTFSPRLQELCGFGAYEGLIGNVDGRPPTEALELQR